MKIALLTFLLVPLFFAGSLHAGEKRNKDFDQIMPPTLKHPPETEARLNKWFRDSKFGAFIHFGAYSPLAGKYKDPREENDVIAQHPQVAARMQQMHADFVAGLPSLDSIPPYDNHWVKPPEGWGWIIGEGKK